MTPTAVRLARAITRRVKAGTSSGRMLVITTKKKRPYAKSWLSCLLTKPSSFC